eukprot:2312670-Pyramimonas_sp.AAC.1
MLRVQASFRASRDSQATVRRKSGDSQATVRRQSGDSRDSQATERPSPTRTLSLRVIAARGAILPKVEKTFRRVVPRP